MEDIKSTMTEEIDLEDELKKNLRQIQRESLEKLAIINSEIDKLVKKRKQIKDILEKGSVSVGAHSREGLVNYMSRIAKRVFFMEGGESEITEKNNDESVKRRDAWVAYLKEEIQNAQECRDVLLRIKGQNNLGAVELFYQQAYWGVEQKWLEYLKEKDKNKWFKHLLKIRRRADTVKEYLNNVFSDSQKNNSEIEERIRQIYTPLFGNFEKEWASYMKEQENN